MGTGPVDGHAQHVQQVKWLPPGTPEQVTASLRPVWLSAAMKYAIGLLAVCALALALLIVHGVVQELNLHRLKTQTASSALAVDTKQQSIVSTKTQVAQLRIEMETERMKAKELAKRHEEIENAKRESEAKIQACNSDKASGG